MMRSIWAWLVFTWGGLHRYFGNKNNIISEHQTAAHYFRRAYEIDPTFYQARLARAVLLWRELGMLREAGAELDDLVEKYPGYGPARFNRAMVAQANGRYRQALDDLNAYIELDDPEYMDEAHRMAALLRDVLSSQGKENS